MYILVFSIIANNSALSFEQTKTIKKYEKKNKTKHREMRKPSSQHHENPQKPTKIFSYNYITLYYEFKGFFFPT